MNLRGLLSGKRKRLASFAPRLESLEERNLLSLSLITDGSQFPAAAIVHLEVTFPGTPSGQFFEGSGTLIDPYHVLTAGHVIYNGAQGGYAADVEVTPGESNGASPFGTARGITERTFPSFISDNAANGDSHQAGDGDIGLVTLDRPIGDQTGWLPVAVASDSFLQGQTLYKVGYPADFGFSGTDMYAEHGPIIGPISGSVPGFAALEWSTSQMSAIAGESGSALYYKDANTNRTIYGVLELGGSSFGYAERITQNVLTTLQGWIAQDAAWAAAGVTMGSDGNARVLWVHDSGAIQIWSTNGSSVSAATTYGPLAGWTPRATAAGADGLTRVLWNNSDGSTALWLVNPDGSLAGATVFGSIAGWRAQDVSVGNDGNTRILWTASDGQMVLWSVSNGFSVTASPVYDPGSGWVAQSISAGADGLTRVLWQNGDGTTALWLLKADGSLQTATVFSAIVGWHVQDIAVSPDGTTRLLWTSDAGQSVVWSVSSSLQVTSGPVFGSLAGWTPAQLTVGADGRARILWDNTNGTAALWVLNPDNSLSTATVFGPA